MISVLFVLLYGKNCPKQLSSTNMAPTSSDLREISTSVFTRDDLGDERVLTTQYKCILAG